VVAVEKAARQEKQGLNQKRSSGAAADKKRKHPMPTPQQCRVGFEDTNEPADPGTEELPTSSARRCGVHTKTVVCLRSHRAGLADSARRTSSIQVVNLGSPRSSPSCVMRSAQMWT
jgi:hypothetical protein